MLAQQLVNGIMLGSVYALVAVAFTFTMGILRFLNFSIPGIFMVAGMVTWAMLKGGASLFLVVPAALAAGAALSWIVERLTYPQMSRGDHFVPLVSSMAFLILLENLMLVAWGSDQQRVVPPFQSVSARLGDLVIGVPQLLGLVLAVGVVAVLDLVLRRTGVGRGVRAIAEDTETATLLGVSVDRVVPLVFMIGGVFTALAGVLFALNYQQASPFMGEEVALKAISAMVVGGMGNIWGAIVGGLVIGIVETAAIHLFGARTVDIWVYGLLLAILFVRPTGLLGGAIAKGRA
jgi:branched-chain amino acid transport system permease protein